METKRAFLAIILSMLILMGYQYFFAPAPLPPSVEQNPVQQSDTPVAPAQFEQGVGSQAQVIAPPPSQVQPASSAQPPVQPNAQARDIKIETELYHAILSENGGLLKSFQLKNFKKSIDKDAEDMELITTDSPYELPLSFNWGSGNQTPQPLYQADRTSLSTMAGGSKTLTMTANSNGLEITRTMTFDNESYMIDLQITVRNIGDQALRGAPYLSTANRPFSKHAANNRFMFNGPAFYMNDQLTEVKTDDLEEGFAAKLGTLSWLAYEDTYFMCSILPEQSENYTVSLALADEDLVTSTVAGPPEDLHPSTQTTYHYGLFFGPKKLATLQETGRNLDKIINFGWFDIIAKPALYMLNFFYGFFGNYGVAIILVTVLFKLVFWPISHKGMKSMKTMQKIQPKMAKLREKYKDDKERLNQEMITLYRTYKINPLGGCLPMVLQIPVFFALYKVLLQTIELRHAPFMFWITDLSAPDRLFIGFDLPYLGGIPVLTLLMGGSMFLQQKMTPTAADPTQAKVMMFLPVVFTFMFLNFASGLVLYWFVNNLLSITQQYVINRSVDN